jgi:hypothetical protein
MRRWGPLGLALVTAVVFWEAVTGRGIFFQRDIHSYWLPLTEAFVRVVLVEGAPPVWNPYPSFGQAMAADPNCQVFYPPTWLNMIVGPATYYSILVVSHTLFAGLGAYLLLRRLGLGELAGFVGGVAWCLSGPLLAGASLYHHFAGAAWMPWVLLALESALARGTLKSGILLGLAAGLQSLAGSADLCFMTALLAAGRGVAYLTRPADRGAPWRLAGVVAMALPLAAMVGAVQWLPARALLAGTTRASQGASVSRYSRCWTSGSPGSSGSCRSPTMRAARCSRRGTRSCGASTWGSPPRPWPPGRCWRRGRGPAGCSPRRSWGSRGCPSAGTAIS